MSIQMAKQRTPDDPSYESFVASDTIGRAAAARFHSEGVRSAEVEDLVQSVRVQLLTSKSRPETALERLRFARKVIADTLASYFRVFSRRRRHNVGLVEAPDDHAARGYADADPTCAIERQEKLESIRGLARQGILSDKHVKMLEMKALEYRVDEIAVSLDMTPANVRNQTKRAREKIFAVVSATAIVLFFGFLTYLAWKKHQEEALPPPTPHVDDTHQLAPSPAKTAEADTLRRDAFARCESFLWWDCGQKLDAAAEIDPESEARPDVQAARAKIADSQKPLPNFGKPLPARRP